MSKDFEYLIANGLRKSTPETRRLFDELTASAVPWSDISADRDNSKKVVAWDSSFEAYLKHRAALIRHEGYERFLPWNAYKSLGLDWLDGFAYQQLDGDCCSFGHRSSYVCSGLSNALLSATGKKPKEIAQSMAYALARGNGKVKFGPGLNLDQMSYYAALKGNYWASDFGKYDKGRYCSKYKAGSEQDAHALQTQSIIVPLPEPSFECCYMVCAAGFGINVGSVNYPGSSTVGDDGLSTEISWSRGGHSFALAGASDIGRPRVWAWNSHPKRYAADRLNPEKQWGPWVDAAGIKKMADGCGGKEMRYGTWYVNIGEM